MMPRKRILAPSARAGLLVCGLAGAVGCSTYPTLKEVPIDCTADDGYEFLTISDFDKEGDAVFWTSGDSTPGRVVGTDNQALVEHTPDTIGARCDSTAAAVLRAAHNNDWGCLFGLNTLGAPRDASAYEGLSFWAVAPGNSTKTFLIALDDPQTAYDPIAIYDEAVIRGHCQNYVPQTSNTPGGGPPQATLPDGTTVSTGSGPTRAAYPDECGNGYTLTMVATSDWAFYTIPFGQFQQDAKPNRVPNAVLTQVGTAPGTALLTHKLMGLSIRMPKEASEELWLDNLAFYRRTATASP
jgi:hypothetical protein